MSLVLRRSNERGHSNHGWLDSYFSFSFADYYDPKHMHFRSLRVINEDVVAPQSGFGKHPHQDMEILTYIVSGELKHADSMGHEAVITAGEVQKISAGTGILHSEMNQSTVPVHLLQIWILPRDKGIKPSYQQMRISSTGSSLPAHEGLTLFASFTGGKDIIKFEQDVDVYRGLLLQHMPVEHHFKIGRGGWLQVIKGSIDVHGQILNAGDAVAIENEPSVRIEARENCEFLLFDLI